jgi:hypothetical protein
MAIKKTGIAEYNRIAAHLINRNFSFAISAFL